MNCLMYVDKLLQHSHATPDPHFLVSGCDRTVQASLFSELVCKCRENQKTLIILDDALWGEDETQLLLNFGYDVRNGLSGAYRLFDPFQLNNIPALSKFRQLLGVLGYSEKEKARLIAYLNFIRYLECLKQETQTPVLSADTLARYCTVQAIETTLDELVEAGAIPEVQRMQLLAKYSELSEAGADFENMFFILTPFVSGEPIRYDHSNAAYVFSTAELGEDDTLRDMVFQLVLSGLDSKAAGNVSVFIFDRGSGTRNSILSLIRSLPAHMSAHIFSKDIFTLGDADVLATISNLFPVGVFSQHIATNSAKMLEELLGGCEVQKQSYNVTYDRRLKSNRVVDVMLGTNKSEAYQATPVWEPRFRKEMIMKLATGSAILNYMGNATVISV